VIHAASGQFGIPYNSQMRRESKPSSMRRQIGDDGHLSKAFFVTAEKNLVDR
jgi:hypothetical protein